MKSLVNGIVLAFLLSLPGVGLAQESEPNSRAERERALFEGTHVLRRILFDSGFQALQSYDDLGEDASKKLLIMLGDLRPLGPLSNRLPGGMETFLRQGGAVLIASDRPVESRDSRDVLMAISGVSINQENLICSRLGECYHQLSYCPRVIGVPGLGMEFFQDRSMGSKSILNVYSNLPSALIVKRRFPGEVRPVATLPPGCLVQTGSGFEVPENFRPLFGVGGNFGEGRVVVLADHSVFINQMMLVSDTANVEFSFNLIRWLQGEGKQRNQVLLVENGAIETRLNIPLRSVAIPPEEALKALFAKRNEILVEGERILADLEDRDAFNRKLMDSLESVGLTSDRLVRLFALLATLMGLVYLCYRIGIRGRFKHDTSLPLFTTTLGRDLPVEPLVEQRQKALLTTGRMNEPAVHLVRRWFAGIGVRVEDVPAPPRFSARGTPWYRWRRCARLKELWQMATGSPTSRITPSELWRLQRELDALDQEWQRGNWQILPTDSTQQRINTRVSHP